MRDKGVVLFVLPVDPLRPAIQFHIYWPGTIPLEALIMPPIQGKRTCAPYSVLRT